MVEVKQLVDNEGEFYPVTAAEAVIFANGENLEEKEFSSSTVLKGIWNTTTNTTTLNSGELEAATEKIEKGEPVIVRLVEDAESDTGYFSLGLLSRVILDGQGYKAFFPYLDINTTNAQAHGLSQGGYYPVILSFSFTGASSIDRILASPSNLSGKEDVANKVTSISSSSTDTQYPSAKCVYDIVGDVELALNVIINGTS